MTSDTEEQFCFDVSDAQENKPGISEWVELQQIGEYTGRW